MAGGLQWWRRSFGVLLVASLLQAQLTYTQLTAPVAHEAHINVDGNKFLQNQADLDSKDSHIGREEALPFEACAQNVELKWSTELSSSIYATPLITDLYSDGRKDIVVPSFVHYLEVLEADNGAQAVGWPAFHKSTTHASPLLYDIDLDGVQDILLTSYNGEIMFFKDTGERLWGSSLMVPRLRVRKYWFQGLNPDPNNRDNTGMGNFADSPKPDADLPFGKKSSAAAGGVAGGGPPKAATQQVLTQLANYRQKMVDYRDKYGDAALRQLLEETHSVNPVFYNLLMDQLKQEGLLGQDGKVHLPRSGGTGGGALTGGTGVEGTQQAAAGAAVQQLAAGSGVVDTRRRLMQAGGDVEEGVEVGPGGGLTEEAMDSFGVFKDAEQKGDAAAVAGGVEDVVAGTDVAYNDNDMLEAADDEGRLKAGPEGQEQQQQQQEEVGELDEAADYHGLLSDADKEQLGAHTEYDELGEKYEVEVPHDMADEAAAADRAAFIRDLTNSIDTTSMEDQEDANSAFRYQHLYFGDYEALAAARDHVLSKYWKNEDFTQAAHQKDEQYVYVDAHVLTTPVIGDIDADGHEELVVAVSYYYDKEYYDQPEHRHEIGAALDLGKYIASGVVAFDLRTKVLKWSQHLDLSTDSTTLKAYAYATPTLADVNRDGQLEVVVGTSMGYLYVLEPNKGDPLPGWPVQMADVQGQALVMDINNDGKVEIVAGDGRGNIAAFLASGEEVWARHVRSMIAQAVSAGDINNDGELEVVFGTSSGHVYALSGSNGADVKGFPFRTHGRIHAPVLITRLQEGPSQQLIVPSFDGYLYLIDGLSACADTVDIGETSYSMVLADDLDGNGRLDLLVATMNGAVYAFETPAKYHPLKTWHAQTVGGNVLLARHDLVGIYATDDARRPRDVAGDKLQIQVRVLDKRAVLAANGSVLTGAAGPYNISAVLRGVGVKEMASGAQPVIGVADTVAAPGLYTLEVPCPRTRSTATVHLELMDGSGMTLSDDFSLSFHMHFHKLLKWLVAGPLIAMVLGLLAVSRSKEAAVEEEARLSLPLATRMH